ncbi:MAG TPA: hypothetical protein VHV51_13040 [Polyangiaceae bacterium]|jgi:hypothetical protein|nr:hypothetical protein [Polyangiaceae bacterium]
MKERFLESLAILIAGLFSAERNRLEQLREAVHAGEPAKRVRSVVPASDHDAQEHPQN